MESIFVYFDPCRDVEMSVASVGPLNPEGTRAYVLPFNETLFGISLEIIDIYASIDIL